MQRFLFRGDKILRRRNIQIGKHVFEFEIFIRLVILENLFAERLDLFDRRHLRNVFLDMHVGAALRFRAPDLASELLISEFDQPAADLTPLRSFTEFAQRP